MTCDKEKMTETLERWAAFADGYALPAWEAIPDFGLYMDQVVVLLGQYLSFIPAAEEGKDNFVTAATINNYVRLKLMPPPVKKKYGRVHLCYLMMILTLKLSLSISEIRQLLPTGLTEAEVQRLYGDFAARLDDTRSHFAQKLHSAAQEADGTALVMEYALSAACYTLLAGKLIRLEEETDKE